MTAVNVAVQPQEDLVVQVENLAREVVVAVGIPGKKGDTGAQGPKGDKGDAGEAVDMTAYYTKVETDTLLTAKANVTHTHVYSDITNINAAPILGGTF